jgi:hypothetical protein
MGWGGGGKIMGESIIFYVRKRGGGVNIYKKCFGPWTAGAFVPLGPFVCPTTEEKNGLLPESQAPRTCIE